MKSHQETIEAATGYCQLGMFSDAWETIETLPPEERTSAPALNLRLRILTALSQWELGEGVARVLLYAGEEDRKTVARFHHARARVLYQSGDFSRARDEIRKAVEAWLDIRKELSDDDLKALLAESKRPDLSEEEI